MKKLHKKVLISSVVAALYAGSAWAGNAVSALNGKVSAATGNVNGSDSKNTAASITSPLGDNFGIQIDGLVGNVGQDELHGTSAHTFWRDSNKGLLGITATHIDLGKTQSNLIGAESEYYFDQFTLGAQGGKQTGDANGTWAEASANYYVTDDLSVMAQYAQFDKVDQRSIEVEYQLNNTGLSLFANVSDGEQNYDQAQLGVRYYLGSQKSLKQRHREDDPRNPIPDALLSSVVAKHHENQGEGSTSYTSGGISGSIDNSGSIGGAGGTIGGGISGSTGGISGGINNVGIISGSTSAASSNFVNFVGSFDNSGTITGDGGTITSDIHSIGGDSGTIVVGGY